MPNCFKTVTLGILCLLLVGAHRAAAQEVVVDVPPRLFTDQSLAPRADWYRPDLAAHRVRQVTRTAMARKADMPSVACFSYQTVCCGGHSQEVLSYDAQGYLLRYQFSGVMAGADGKPLTLENQFSYDAQHRLSGIQLTGANYLLAVEDLVSSKTYAHQHRRDTTFRQRHGLPTAGYLYELFPDSWQLQAVTCSYPAGGPARPRAIVMLRGHQSAEGDPNTWTDTVALDPRRNWSMAGPDTLAGYADTTWLGDKRKWWLPKVPTNTATAPGLRVLAVPYSGDDVDRYRKVEAMYGFTSFYDAAGRLRLLRKPGSGVVWRYTYNSPGQPLRVEAFFMHLPKHYDDTLYYGNARDVRPIADCGQRQRQALATFDGEQAVREFGWACELRYEMDKQGLPRRAILHTSLPRYAADVSFDELLSTTYSIKDGHYRRRRDWRHIRAMQERASQFRQQGCVPMKLHEEDTPALEFSYEFFP